MNIVAWIPIFAIVAIVSLWCVWHVFQREPRFIPRWGWILMVVFLPPVGATLYILVEVLDAGTKRLDAEGRQPRSE